MLSALSFKKTGRCPDLSFIGEAGKQGSATFSQQGDQY